MLATASAQVCVPLGHSSSSLYLDIVIYLFFTFVTTCIGELQIIYIRRQ